MNPRRIRTIGTLPVLPLLFLFFLASCERVDVDATVDEATRLLRAVRPGVNVSGVQIRSLRPWVDSRALLDGEQRVEVVTKRRCLIEHADLLQRFCLVNPGEVELLLARVSRGSFVDRPAFANHHRSVVWIPAKDLGSVEVIAHELAWIASARQNYAEANRHRIHLSEAGDDVTRIDLDALLALDLLREADAAFTTEAALRYRADRESGLAELWRERVYLEGEADSSFGSLSGSRQTLPEAMDELAHRGSRSLLQALHRPGEGLEPALERAWSGFSYTTREILFPRDAHHRSSRFAASARHFDARVRRVVRFGAFLTWRMLLRETNLRPRHVLDIVRSFEDDILVQSDREGPLWITEWSSAESASAFAALYRGILDGARVELEGDLVIASFGDVGDRERILRVIR